MAIDRSTSQSSGSAPSIWLTFFVLQNHDLRFRGYGFN